MGRRVLTFFLGMLFGIIFVVGGVALAVYIVVCKVEVNKFVPSADTYMGDLANKSAYDIVMDVYNLYGQKVGVADENGRYYTLQEFCDNYNINLETALDGMKLPAEVLEMPAFEFFADGGMERALKQIKVSSVPAVINMLGNGEDKTFGPELLDELAKFSMYDLLSDEVGFKGVLANVRLTSLLPSAFPAEDSNNKLMWAIGQTYIGRALNGVSGGENIMMQLKPDGAFEALGGLKISDMTGEDSQYVNAVFGEGATLSDLINNDGNLDIDGVLNDVYLGGLLGCQRNKIGDIEGYEEIFTGGEDKPNLKVLAKTADGQTLLVRTDDGETYYQARLDCLAEENGEQHDKHTAECYDYVWYSTTVCDKEKNHNHAEDGDLYLEDAYYPEVDGLYAAFVNLTLGDLTNGDDAALMREVKRLTLYDVLGEDVPDMLKEVQYTNLGNLDGTLKSIHLGSAMNYLRRPVKMGDYPTEVMRDAETGEILRAGGSTGDYKTAIYAKSPDGEKWYEAKFECFNRNHTHRGDHTIECFPYVWYSKCKANCAINHEHDNYFDDEYLYLPVKGVSKAFVNCTMDNVGEKMDELTMRQLGINNDGNHIIKAIEDVRIMDIAVEINKISMGVVFGYEKQYLCGDDNHEHTASCPYRWLEECKNHTSASLHDETEHVTADFGAGQKTYAPVKGLNAKIADKTVKQIGSGDGVTEIALSLTIGDLIDSGMLDIGGKNNEYKFAIIYCGSTPKGSEPCEYRQKCSLSGYMLAHAQNSSLTAEEYWQNAHKDMPAEEREEHRYSWKSMILNDFMNMLLQSI